MNNSLRTVLLFISGIVSVFVFLPRRRRAPNLDAFPTAGCSFGPSGCFSSFYLGAWRFLIDAPGVLREGYEKYGNRPFKVATMLRWTVVLNDPQQMVEIANTAEEDLSFSEAMKDIMGVDHTLGININSADNALLAELLRSHVSRNTVQICGEIQAELLTTLSSVLGNGADEWTVIPALGTVNKIMARSWQRFFVGSDLCHDQWCSLVADIHKDVALVGVIRRLVPSWAFSFFARMVSNLQRNIESATALLRPVVETRIRDLDENSSSYHQKIDLLSRLIKRSAAEDRLLKNLTTRLLGFTVAVASTPSNTFTHALYHLATDPDAARALRDEVDLVIQRDGWNVHSVGKLHKIDSFLKESSRINGVSSLGFFRQAMCDISLSDGTILPKDCFVAVSLLAFHGDSAVYEAPHEFRPFRFLDHPEGGMTTITPHWLYFGYGKHACPGRFLLTHELKVMLAYIVSAYDVRIEDGRTVRPPNFIFGEGVVPNMSARISYRKRRSTNDEKLHSHLLCE